MGSKQTIAQMAFTEVLALVANLVSTETIADWGKAIAVRHLPGNPLELPGWLKPQPEKAAPPAAKPAHAAKQPAPTSNVAKATTSTSTVEKTATATEMRKQLICATCGDKITYAEGKFCWNNEKRFGGSQYCREHKKAF